MTETWPEKVRRLAVLYRATFPEKVATIREAAERIAQSQPCAVEHARDLAHQIQGTGASYGYPELTETARAAAHAGDAELLQRLADLCALLERLTADARQ